MGKYSQPRDPQQNTTAVPEELTSSAPDALDEFLTESADLILDGETAPSGEATDSLDEIQEILREPVYAPVKKKNSKAKNRKIVLISLCSVAAVLLIGIIASLVYLFALDPNDGKILNNVSVAGINIGNMSKSEAKAAIRAATDGTYTQKDMVIHFPDADLHLTPGNTGAQLDVDTLVNDAFDYGRVGTEEEREQALAASLNSEHPIALLPYLTLNLDYIRQELDNYEKAFNSVYTASAVELDGAAPVVDASLEEFTGEFQDRNLVIYTGTPGRHINFDEVYDRILDAYSFNKFELTVEMDEAETIPEKIDLEALYHQYYSEVRDAVVDPETFEVTMEVYGYEFDLEAAQALLDNAVYGETFSVPMILTAPEVLGGPYRDVYFRDILCEYKTEHTKDEDRNTNLTLACAAINGMVLAPGEEFDYNTVVGKRTAEKGYKAAAAYSSGKTVKDIGGGVCQVSSTIYYCCLVSDLEIINRLPHSYVSSYMPMGMDATVNWGGPEFTFKNNTNYPIRIETWVADGYVHCKLLGTDEKDYYIEMEYEITGVAGAETVYEEFTADNNPNRYRDGQVVQTAYKGYWVNTYKNKYDKETGELIVREFDRQSVYKKRDKIIAKLVTPAPPATPPAPDAGA